MAAKEFAWALSVERNDSDCGLLADRVRAIQRFAIIHESGWPEVLGRVSLRSPSPDTFMTCHSCLIGPFAPLNDTHTKQFCRLARLRSWTRCAWRRDHRDCIRASLRRRTGSWARALKTAKKTAEQYRKTYASELPFLLRFCSRIVCFYVPQRNEVTVSSSERRLGGHRSLVKNLGKRPAARYIYVRLFASEILIRRRA